MKKVLLLSLLMSFVFITTGCIKCTYNIEIDKKNNVSVTETQAVNLKMMSSFVPNADGTMKQDFTGKIGEEITKKSQEYAKKGYKVEKYSDGTFDGMTVSKQFKMKSMKNEDLPEGFTSNNDVPIVHNYGFFRDTYEIALKYDPSKISKYSSAQNNSQNQLSQMMGNPLLSGSGAAPKYTLTIKLPYKASNTNATKVLNDNEYEWTIPSGGTANILISYEKYNLANIIFTILLIIVLFIVASKYSNYINSSNW